MKSLPLVAASLFKWYQVGENNENLNKKERELEKKNQMVKYDNSITIEKIPAAPIPAMARETINIIILCFRLER